MSHIYTRQNAKGNWWCNGTIAPFGDISFESSTISGARNQMYSFLSLHGLNSDDFKWSEPAYYVSEANQPVNHTMRLPVGHTMRQKVIGNIRDCDNPQCGYSIAIDSNRIEMPLYNALCPKCGQNKLNDKVLFCLISKE